MSDVDMTTAEQSLADDKMRAEIAKLIAETSKINAEARWYPLAVATGLVGAIAGLTAFIIKLFGL
ncbi:hypothetical protein EQ718_13990 (plasmid) [Paracoccus versutus]|uniref:Uncharacterized protein n=3 Tax=Paracoccus TaxID=265 RepID=A0AAE6TT23_PARPN|nr:MULTISPECIES: hypothetical protein [Paracoccus]QFG36134.1 hypothetical protein ESD82_07815 [Paracoccus pantotrophus]REG26921.1 hypothetical protein ATH84_10804 [Paracoccus versutus]RKS42591.1 hypothetical protein BDE18_4296 [Paracoccus pantotrophus]RNI14235.1 hypothetical protein EB844_20610 [Paracoccus pantotrophus]WEJ80035.1 hypothetical protein EQ718_13990 [Paracoccus versutus]